MVLKMFNEVLRQMGAYINVKESVEGPTQPKEDVPPPKYIYYKELTFVHSEIKKGEIIYTDQDYELSNNKLSTYYVVKVTYSVGAHQSDGAYYHRKVYKEDILGKDGSELYQKYIKLQAMEEESHDLAETIISLRNELY